MRQIILLSIISTFIGQDIFSQETGDQIRKNLIKGSIASSGYLNGKISIDYERNIIFRDFFKFNIEGTYGKYYQLHSEPSFQSYPSFTSITSSINSLFGRKSHFLEVTIGARYSNIKVDYYDDIHPVFPEFHVGYRYQNYHKNGLIFKIFLGTTGLGLSTGIEF